MARRYKVEGTRDYLYLAIGLFALGIWAIKDGWYPSKSVLEKHPLEVAANFEAGGLVDEVLVVPEQDVAEKQPLVRLKKTLKAEAPAGKGEDAGRDPESLMAHAPVSGQVLSVEVQRGDMVAAGDLAVRIRPADSFYLFNKSLAILSLLGAVISAVVHQFVK
ncbi:MAG: hypothetical protein U1E27_05335 [Kiritimatiellia bacterium]|nr:hypothetical protein [Kiritimatiellia bacterium]